MIFDVTSVMAKRAVKTKTSDRTAPACSSYGLFGRRGFYVLGFHSNAYPAAHFEHPGYFTPVRIKRFYQVVQYCVNDMLVKDAFITV